MSNDKIKSAEVTPGATASPVPQIEVNPKEAPGLKGPKGLSPKTNYSRMNTGLPPLPDAGAAAQKSAPPMGATMLPKLASEEYMASATPTLQELVKAAMASTTGRVNAANEATLQMNVKTAAADCKDCGKADCKCGDKTASVSTDYAEKLARALEYVTPFVEKKAEVRPGEGPGALTVMEAKAEGQLPEHHGQAHAQPPMNPGTQKSTPTTPNNQMQNDKDRAPGGSEKMVQKNAAALQAILSKTAKENPFEKKETEGMNQAEKGLDKAQKAHASENKEEKEEKKEASGLAALADFVRSQVKQAEDAINPAQISAGPAVAPETSAAGEAGGAPAGGKPQGPTGLVSSNESAINYNRAQARANRKADMGKYVDEPMQSTSTDSTLSNVLSHHSAKDGNKFAAAKDTSVKTAAARALLQKLAQEEKAKEEDEKKTKDKGAMHGANC